MEDIRYCKICGSELEDDDIDICKSCMAIMGYVAEENLE